LRAISAGAAIRAPTVLPTSVGTPTTALRLYARMMALLLPGNPEFPIAHPEEQGQNRRMPSARARRMLSPPLHRPSSMPRYRRRASERSRRASGFLAGALHRRLDEEVTRVPAARDMRFPLERRVNRDGMLGAYSPVKTSQPDTQAAARARYSVEQCGDDPAARHRRRAVISIEDRGSLTIRSPRRQKRIRRLSARVDQSPLSGRKSSWSSGSVTMDPIISGGTGRTQAECRRGAPCLPDLRRLPTAASSSVLNSSMAAVVDDHLHVALVVLDDKPVVLGWGRPRSDRRRCRRGRGGGRRARARPRVGRAPRW